jgi:acyl-CoA synthetase (AMP-forming)/AMP-acid ligase II
MSETLLSRWHRLVARQPGALALIEAATGRRVSRRELDDLAAAWRAALPVQVVRRRVAFALPNGAEWFAAFIGLLKAGAIPVPLDASEPPAAQRRLAASARAARVWIEGALESVASATSPARHRAPGLVKLTSGSTGRPKALAFTDAQMLADGRQICRTMRINPDDLNFAVIPFGHSYGLGNLVVPLLDQGTACVCGGLPLPQVIAADITRWQPTVFPAVPALLRALALSDVAPASLASLRTVISAGSPLSAETATRFSEKFKIPPRNFYGSSETGGIAYDRDGAATLAGRSVGTAMDGVAITPARGGRFHVTSAAVHGRGRFSPADLGACDGRGELVLRGRTGRLVKIAGRRLDLGDFERELQAIDGVDEAFAAPHPQTPGELAVVLATTLSPAALRLRLRGRLAAWKIPRRIVPVARFPLTPRGKPDSQKLQQLISR